MPLVSIVVPTFNSADVLPALLQNLANQSFRDFEVVVSDGGSRDATVSIAEAFSSKLPGCTVSSRPDRGAYDAINQGIALATGRWVLVLGSDDRLFSTDTLALAAPLLAQASEMFVYGDVLVEGDTSWAKHGQVYDGEFNLAKLLRKNICQQAIFYRRELFALAGCFEQRYKICADWDFAWRIYAKYPVRYVPLTIGTFVAGGLSSTGDANFAADRFQKLVQYFGWRLGEKSFLELRWDFKEQALLHWKRRKFTLAFYLFAAYLRLGIRSRLAGAA